MMCDPMPVSVCASPSRGYVSYYPPAVSAPTAFSTPQALSALPLRPALDTTKLFDRWELNASWQYLMTSRPPKRHLDSTRDHLDSTAQLPQSHMDIESRFEGMSEWNAMAPGLDVSTSHYPSQRPAKRAYFESTQRIDCASI
ncbi:hypothetical protein BASA60_007164 [Batrachochytrium salamandrivorans]|nr:hypothetical protein BASA60_007164 [Batrachochytrium salamandrivorans]KAH9269778.1 hypothetical protein BASA83_008093 [Batrachochytrium salamandrivorans]